MDGRSKDPETGKANNKRTPFYFEGSRADAVAWYASLCRSKRAPATIPLAPTIKQAWPNFTEYYENKVAKTTYRDYLPNGAVMKRILTISGTSYLIPPLR